jgi:hypothetical protein
LRWLPLFWLVSWGLGVGFTVHYNWTWIFLFGVMPDIFNPKTWQFAHTLLVKTQTTPQYISKNLFLLLTILKSAWVQILNSNFSGTRQKPKKSPVSNYTLLNLINASQFDV